MDSLIGGEWLGLGGHGSVGLNGSEGPGLARLDLSAWKGQGWKGLFVSSARIGEE